MQHAKQKESERDKRIHARMENVEVMHDNLYVGTPTEIIERVEAIGREERNQWENGFRKSDRSAAAYRRTYGAYVESLSPQGRITVEDFTRLEAKELQLAQWLADAGHTVDFRNANAHNATDGKTTDVLLDHELWEFKRIESRRAKKIGERIAEKAEKQGPRFVVDMSTSTIDETVAMQKVAELLDNPFVEEVILIIDGKALRQKK